MSAKELGLRRTFFVRVTHDAELLRFITDFAQGQRIEAAHFTALGALKTARLGFYDQVKHIYGEETVSKPTELASCIGNVSLKDGVPFVHAHAVLSEASGKVKAGHLIEGRVFAAEMHLTEFKGKKMERKPDPLTGLSLWEI